MRDTQKENQERLLRRKESLETWRSLSNAEQIQLYIKAVTHAKDTGHFTETWTFPMFSSSTGQICRAIEMFEIDDTLTEQYSKYQMVAQTGMKNYNDNH